LAESIGAQICSGKKRIFPMPIVAGKYKESIGDTERIVKAGPGFGALAHSGLEALNRREIVADNTDTVRPEDDCHGAPDSPSVS
jgi:hypothetical protein